MDAGLVSAWNALVVQLSCVFTAPTVRLWQQIALGWVLHRGPATVTGIYRTLGDLADRHWTTYEKFFYRAAWSLQDLPLRLLTHVVDPLIRQSGVIDDQSGKPVVDLVIDDTTAARSGKHVAHAGWFSIATVLADSSISYCVIFGSSGDRSEGGSPAQSEPPYCLPRAIP